MRGVWAALLAWACAWSSITEVSSYEQNYVDSCLMISLTGTDFTDDEFGGAVALLTDTNHDSIRDLAVGAPAHSIAEEVDGGGYVFHTNVGLLTLFSLRRSGMWKKYRFFSGDDLGLGSGALFGSAVAVLRDLDDNGNTELAVGAPGDNQIVFIYLKANGALSNYSLLDAATAQALSPVSFGSSLASGVQSNETNFDLAVGDPESANDGVLTLLNLTDALGARQAAVVTASWNISAAAVGLANQAGRFGAAVAVLPDLDGNGVNELLVGAPYYGSQAGAVVVLFMLPGSAGVKAHVLLTPDDLDSTTLSATSRFGTSVAFVSQESNGTTVVAVGAPRDSTLKAKGGAVVVLYLSREATVEYDFFISDLSGVSGAGSQPVTANRLFGTAVAGMRDLDEDGHNDIFVGAPGSGSCGSFYELFMDRIYTDDAYVAPSPAPAPGAGLDSSGSGLVHIILAVFAFWSITSCCYAAVRLRYRLMQAGVDRAARDGGEAEGHRRHAHRSGLTRDQISALTVTPFGNKGACDKDEPETCAVCLTDFVGGECVKHLPCGHVYHPQCIDTWLRTSPKCPLCQQHVAEATNLNISSASRAVAGTGDGAGGGASSRLLGDADQPATPAWPAPPSQRRLLPGGYHDTDILPTEIELSTLSTSDLRRSGVLVLDGQLEEDEGLLDTGAAAPARPSSSEPEYTALAVRPSPTCDEGAQL